MADTRELFGPQCHQYLGGSGQPPYRRHNDRGVGGASFLRTAEGLCPRLGTVGRRASWRAPPFIVKASLVITFIYPGVCVRGWESMVGDYMVSIVPLSVCHLADPLVAY